MADSLENIPACAGCGQCCHLLVELVAGDDVPEELVVEHSGVRCLDQHGDGACMALDLTTRLCTIYERRPQTCRQFERGSGLCRSVLGSRRAMAMRGAEQAVGARRRKDDGAKRESARDECGSATGHGRTVSPKACA